MDSEIALYKSALITPKTAKFNAKYSFSVFTVLNYRELKSQLFGMNVMKIL